MYEPNERFFDENGAVNIELAMAAGRKARSQALSEGFSLAGDTAVRLFQSVWRAAIGFYTRVTSSRTFQSKTAL